MILNSGDPMSLRKETWLPYIWDRHTYIVRQDIHRVCESCLIFCGLLQHTHPPTYTPTHQPAHSPTHLYIFIPFTHSPLTNMVSRADALTHMTRTQSCVCDTYTYTVLCTCYVCTLSRISLECHRAQSLYICTCKNTYIHVYIYTYIHKYTYICIYIYT